MFQTKFLCSSFVIEKCIISKCMALFFFLQNFFATFTVTLDWEGKIGTGWPRCEVSSASSRSDSQRDCKASGRVGDRIVIAQEVRNFGKIIEMSNLMIVIFIPCLIKNFFAIGVMTLCILTNLNIWLSTSCKASRILNSAILQSA